MKFRIADIIVTERKRDLGDISSLAQSIKDLGLLNPITLLQDGTLVAGYHRLSVYKMFGWDEIEANVVDLDSLHAELAEIDENLIRNDLHWTEKDDQLARRKEIYEALHPETKPVNERGGPGRGHKTNEIISAVSAPSFTEDTASKTKQTPRTVELSVQRAKTFTAEQKEVLRRADVTQTDATKLTRLQEPIRQAVIEKIASGQASKVGSALLELKKEENIAQAQAAPSKPYVAQASWETWLPQQPMCDLLITDPPYSTDIDDIEAFANSWLPLALSKVKPTGRAYVCIGAYPRELQAYLNVQSSMQVHQVLVWSYRNTIGPSPTHNYKQNWQAILYFCGPDAPPLNCPILNEQFSAQEINAPDGRMGDRYHAWQKPDKLADQLIRHSTKPGDIVIDCFAGTGTFLLAAHRLGRVALGCDQSPAMIDLAKMRGCEVKDAA